MRAAIILLALALPSFATTHQVIFGISGALTTNAAGWIGVSTAVNEQATATASVCVLMPTAGTFDLLNVRLSSAPSTGKSFTFTLWKSSTSPCSGGADQAVTVTIADTNTTATDNTHTLAVIAGDYVSIHITESGTPSAVSAPSWNVRFTPTVDDETVLFASQAGTAAATFQSLSCPGLATATETSTYTIAASAGTIKKLYTQAATAAGSTNAWVWTVNQNGSPSTITTTATNTNALQNDSTHTFSAAAGDGLDIHVTITNTPTSSDIYASVVFVPTTSGQFWIPMTRANSGFNGASTTYGPIAGRIGSQSATESTLQAAGAAMYVQAIYAYSSSDIGSGKTYKFTLRKAAGDTTLNCTASGGAAPSTCNTTGASITIADFDLLDTSEAPTGTPTVPTSLSVSYLATTNAPGAGTAARHRVIAGLHPASAEAPVL